MHFISIQCGLCDMNFVGFTNRQLHQRISYPGSGGPFSKYLILNKPCLRFDKAIRVHTYCTKWATFRFALPAWNLFTQEEKDRASSQLSAGQVFGKIRVLAKSRNRCKLFKSLFRFHCSAWFFRVLYF